MTVLFGVIGAAVLMCLVYLLVLWAESHVPRCPKCKRPMHYDGDDESHREVWSCPFCGLKALN